VRTPWRAQDVQCADGRAPDLFRGTGKPGGVQERKLNLEILLVSLAIILLEINYTRVFSFKLYYYFTYLILGIAMLGIGAGGVTVTVLGRLREVRAERLLPVLCMLGAVSAPLGYAVVAGVQINTSLLDDEVFELVKLVVVCLAVFLPCLSVGIIISTIFGARPEAIGRLYFADLMGAGLGCAISVPLLIIVSPPGCVVLAGAILAAAGLRLTRAEYPRLLPAAAALSIGLAGLSVFGSALPDPVTDANKTMSPQRRGESRSVHSEWSPVFRVDLIDQSPPGSEWPPPRLYLNHDGMLGASLLHFDGDYSKLGFFDQDTRSSAFSIANKDPRVLIIGAAGGHEILASLYFGASHIRAVELNPITYSLLDEHFSDYSGRIAHDEKVDLINYEGRTFLERDDDLYDLIWFVAPDSYSAMNAASSGAFVLSESYLYTTEMIDVALDHLAPGGILSVQFGEILFAGKPNRTARYLATARQTLQERGVADFRRHILLSTVPEFFTMATILIKNDPFSVEEIRRFRAHEATIDRSEIWHAAGAGGIPNNPAHPVRRVMELTDESLAAYFDVHPYQLYPVTDDAPFFWHFARFENSFDEEFGGNEIVWDPEDATGERVLVILLLLATSFAAVFLLLPLVAIRNVWRHVPHKLHAGLYFAALGLGFMFFEVVLIQQMTLFLGYPTYSLTVTLFSLLIFTGVGSLLTERYANRRNRALLSLLGALFVLMLFYRLGLASTVSAFITYPLAARIPIAIAIIAPLGLCLGAFMPIGLTTVARLSSHEKQYIAWAWAVNGFFSVMSSILATILSMSFGFQAVLMIGMVVYAVGIVSMTRIPEPSA
jgi:spermidine synthase